jgi:hypothetical protein
MKYIKAYENVGDKIPELKKYVIWKSTKVNNLLEIIPNKNNTIVKKPRKNEQYDTIKVKHLYNCNAKGEILKPNLNAGKTTGLLKDDFENSIRNYLLYQSDSLQDCLDIMPLLVTSDKYNL